MKLLCNKEQYNECRGIDLLPLECEYCGRIFFHQKKLIKYSLKGDNICKLKYCSRECTTNAANIRQTVECKNCAVSFVKKSCQIKISPNHFCTRSCATTYNNTHKSSGNRRSKLEAYIETKLSELYPNMCIEYNGKDAINSELDIYIPSLHLAFELNGIFHYEPIYGQDKLRKIENNDTRKFQACIERGIELCIIDTSSLKYSIPRNMEKYVSIIDNIISEKGERFELPSRLP